MAVQLVDAKEDDLKTQFSTREGTYRLMTLSEYSRPNRVGYTSNQQPQVRVSIVSLLPGSGNQQQQSNSSPTTAGKPSLPGDNHPGDHHQDEKMTSPGQGSVGPPLQVHQVSSTTSNSNIINNNSLEGGPVNGFGPGGDRICFNFGKELFVYAYRGAKKQFDGKPIDKKLYKGTNPSCHDFNAANATAEGAQLLVGFTTGQIQLVHPGRREPGKLYNEERLIDKTKVTCLKWLPGSSNLFLAAHASGHLYLYNEELPCSPTAPNYQTFKVGEGYLIYTCKSKSTRNPLYKWTFGTDNCSINEFCFSPCGSMLAIASQDGFLRVFQYDTMELLGIARSYFGGFLCVCWSPDGKYIVVGGEDDLVTVWSLNERRVVARGQGHRSWVSVVAFDPYTTSYSSLETNDFSDDENPVNEGYNRSSRNGFRGQNQNQNLVNNNTNNGLDEFSTTRKQQTMMQNGIPSNSSNNSNKKSSMVIGGGGAGGGSGSPSELKTATSYRLGSVSQDTQLCLWDITEDLLRQPIRARLSSGDQQQQLTSNEKMMSSRISIKPVEVNNGQNSLSSVSSSSMSSTSNANNTNNNNRCNPEVDGNSKVMPGKSEKSTSNANSNKSKSSIGSISLIGNCVGNNLNKLTMSSSISSTSSITSNHTGQAILEETNQRLPEMTESNGNGKTSKSSSESSHSSVSAFSTLTQRLSNFSFGNDRRSISSNNNNNDGGGHNQNNNSKKGFTLAKSLGHNSSKHNSSHPGSTATNCSTSTGTPNGTLVTGTGGSSSAGRSGGGQSSSCSSVVSTYDPMKLIGTGACPRFDECPVLEPLICKKIAHERLTALIFREDCFLTACQDGIIYTWARPGYSV